jgi:hypothetical protein
LSTLVEEDEEAALEATHSSSAGALPGLFGVAMPEDDDTNMDLTGTTGGVAPGARPQPCIKYYIVEHT